MHGTGDARRHPRPPSSQGGPGTPEASGEALRRDRGRRRPQRPHLRRLPGPRRTAGAGMRAPPRRGRPVRGVRVLPRLPRVHHQLPRVAGAQGGGRPGAGAPRPEVHPPGPDPDVPVPRRPRVHRMARARTGHGADPPILGQGRRWLRRAVRLPEPLRQTPRRLAVRGAANASRPHLPPGDPRGRGGVRQGIPRQRRRPARRVPRIRAPQVDARDARGHVELDKPAVPRLRDVADDAPDVARIVERRRRSRPATAGPAWLHGASPRGNGEHRAGHAPLAGGRRRGGAHGMRGRSNPGHRRARGRGGAGGRGGDRGRRRGLEPRPVDDVPRPDRRALPGARVPRRGRAAAAPRLGVQGGAGARRHPGFAAAPRGLERACAGCQFRIAPSIEYQDRAFDDAKRGRRRGVRCSGDCSRPWRIPAWLRPAGTF